MSAFSLASARKIRMSQKKAVAWIRRFRGTSKKSAPGMDLTRPLIHCINDYCETHPETTRQQIETVLENVARCLEPDE